MGHAPRRVASPREQPDHSFLQVGLMDLTCRPLIIILSSPQQEQRDRRHKQTVPSQLFPIWHPIRNHEHRPCRSPRSHPLWALLLISPPSRHPNPQHHHQPRTLLSSTVSARSLRMPLQARFSRNRSRNRRAVVVEAAVGWQVRHLVVKP